MVTYEKAPIQWPDQVTVTTDTAAVVFRRVPQTSYYRYEGAGGIYPTPPRHFESIDPAWLASEGRIVVVQPSEEEIGANPELREAFQFIVL
jgi:hypothetical protein